MRKWREFFTVVSLCIVTLYSSGCIALVVGAAAGAGGMIWVKGKLEQDLNASFNNVYQAAHRALKKMDLPILVDQKDKIAAKIESEFSDKARVWIELKYVAARITKISIRVGTLGDENRSRQILEAIENYL